MWSIATSFRVSVLIVAVAHAAPNLLFIDLHSILKLHRLSV
jgi:hypothetical protein